ncbi:peptide N-acetyl transferase [Scheffersomyces stipitis CBS 6054]|uniref:Peptide N-acetyl transferase n=1 Tax=Scheffersomyces stipitis (strain ATCC 58785 / CBS 6054 / NBRC 10063 / NRRL Y-11545) TaxID=322104 RepID=A3M098_PICST|nr:peptide N-acetyl transferase [Scheffersomyces stipitis CBS 6054]ABN68677.2 peptide N-acetyl transferase [Scheffersomyces stipitis CBS 6054]
MGRDIVSLDDLTVNNIGVFKKINSVTLPTSYSEQWYKDSLNTDQIVKLAYYSELPVGAIKAKTINSAHKISTYENMQQQQINAKIVPNAVYVESFAVLEAYRGLGIGERLLKFLEEETKKKFIHEIVFHVHIDNTAAVEWYEKHGFAKSEEVLKDYYKDQGLSNPDAFILSKSI